MLPKPRFFENTRIFVPVVLLLALGLSITGYYYYSRQKHIIKLQVQSELLAIADLKVAEIDDWRKERLGDAEVIFQNPFVSKSLLDFLANPTDLALKKKIQTWMASFYERYDYNCIFLLDANGLERLKECEKEEPVEDYAQKLAREAMQNHRVNFSDLHQNPATGEAHLDLLIPLFSVRKRDTLSRGCLVLRINPADFFYPLIQSWPGTNRTGETLLVRRDGDAVVFLSSPRDRKNAALSLRFPVSKVQMPAIMAVRGGEGIVEGTDYRGVSVLAALRRVPDSSWFLVAKMDEEEINAPIRQQGLMVALVLAALLLAAASFAGLLWRQQRIRLYRQHEEALRESEKRFRDLADFLPQVVYEIDTSGKICFTNRHSFDLFGYSRSDFENGLSAYQMLIPEERDKARQNIERVMRGEKLEGNEYTAMRKDGSTFPIVVHSSPIIRDGVPQGLRGIIVDVSDLKRANERLTSINESFLQLGSIPSKTLTC